MVASQVIAKERCVSVTRELASQLLGLMDGLCETEQGRLAVAVLRYIATGEMKEPRGTERAFFTKACEMCDVQMRNIYINNSKDSLFQSMGRISSNLFDTFWNAYPVKVNKKRCIELWKKINPDEALLQKMLDSIEAWKQSRRWREGFIKDPDTWLRNECWNDVVPDEAKQKNPALSYKQRPISQADIDAMTVDLSEV